MQRPHRTCGFLARAHQDETSSSGTGVEDGKDAKGEKQDQPVYLLIVQSSRGRDEPSMHDLPVRLKEGDELFVRDVCNEKAVR